MVEPVKNTNSKPIISALRNLSQGEKTTFPILQYSSVAATISRMKILYPKQKFAVKRDMPRSVVEVSRIY